MAGNLLSVSSLLNPFSTVDQSRYVSKQCRSRRDEPSDRDLYCLPFCSWLTTITLLAAMDVSKYWEERFCFRNSGFYGLNPETYIATTAPVSNDFSSWHLTSGFSDISVWLRTKKADNNNNNNNNNKNKTTKCFWYSWPIASLGGSVGCAVRLETRRSRVQTPPRPATFFCGDWSWNIF